MSQFFLNPLLLTALLAAAIPIFVHLARRDEDDRAFPSLMFLKRLLVEDTRRRTLRDKALLLARLAALALLVLAFARPLLPLPDTLGSSDARGNHTVMLIDVSASMGMPRQPERALAIIDEVVAALPAGATVAAVAFDDTARLVYDFSVDHDAVRGAARGAVRSAASGAVSDNAGASTRYAPAFRLANELLRDHADGGTRVVVISDLQAAGFDDAAVGLLTDTSLDVLPVQEPLLANTTIRRLKRDGDTLVADVTNTGELPSTPSRYQLRVNGNEQSVEIDGLVPGQSRALSFPLASDIGDAVVVELVPDASTSAEDIGMPADARRALVETSARRLSVLVVTASRYRSQPVAPSTAVATSYLTHAARLAENTRVVEVTDRDLVPTSFADMDAIIFDDGVLPRAALADALAARIEAGVGTLFVNHSGELSSPAKSNPLRAYFPADFGRDDALIESPTGRAFRIQSFDAFHPVSADFVDSTLGERAFSTVRLLAYRRFSISDGFSVLATLDNGDPLLVEAPSNAGRVLVLTATLEPDLGDIALAPGFAPLIHRIIDYLTDRKTAPSAYHRGEVIELTRHGASNGSAFRTAMVANGAVIETPSGDQIRLSPGNAYFRPTQIGVHQVRPSRSDLDTVAIAVNANPLESKLSRLDIDGFTARIERHERTRREDGGATVEQQPEQNNFWRWLLVVAAALFLLECFYANRLTNKRHGTT